MLQTTVLFISAVLESICREENFFQKCRRNLCFESVQLKIYLAQYKKGQQCP